MAVLGLKKKDEENEIFFYSADLHKQDRPRFIRIR